MALAASLGNEKMKELGGKGYLVNAPVAAATTIYKGARVCANSSGYVEPVTVTGAVNYLGRAQEAVDNSAGLDGALNVSILRGAVTYVPWTSAALTDLGKLLWFTADDTPTLTPNANIGAAGTVVKVEVGVGVYIDENINARQVT